MTGLEFPVALFLLAYPLVATKFWIVAIGAQSLFLGVIALSLMFLAGYGGMVSLSQMTVAGAAGYMLALFGTTNKMDISLGWPWWAYIPTAVIIATAAKASARYRRTPNGRLRTDRGVGVPARAIPPLIIQPA